MTWYLCLRPLTVQGVVGNEKLSRDDIKSRKWQQVVWFRFVHQVTKGLSNQDVWQQSEGSDVLADVLYSQFNIPVQDKAYDTAQWFDLFSFM